MKVNVKYNKTSCSVTINKDNKRYTYSLSRKIHDNLIKDEKLLESLAKAQFEILFGNKNNLEKRDILNNLLKELGENSFEYAECLNSSHCINKDTSRVIFGSITPHNASGWFYTSQSNKTYWILDKIFNTNLNANLELINNCPNDKEEIIKNIKTELRKIKMGFLDVVESCIRVKNDASDSAIILYIPISLEYLEKVNIVNAKKYCNSQFVKKIMKQININCLSIASPSGNSNRAYSKKAKENRVDVIEYKIKNWKEAFDK